MVFLVNLQALEILQIKENNPAKLSIAALAKKFFLLLYSPKRSLLIISKEAAVEFTDEEIKHFKRHFGEAYEVPGDTRYIE